MTGLLEPEVGLRVHLFREQRGLSLRALAERCGLSINAISLIERGECSPTIASLHALATALEVEITDFFKEANAQRVVFVRRHQRLAAQGQGVLMESLGIGLHRQQLEPFLMTLEPGAGSAADSITHPGQEFVYCLDGALEYRIGSESYVLTAGDSLLFEASQPHGFRCQGTRPAQILLVFQAAGNSPLARQSHLDS